MTEPEFPTDTYAGRKTIPFEEKFTQAHTVIQFPAAGWREHPYPVRRAASMANSIIGGSPVSRLWRALREDRGWVYSVSSDIYAWPYLGVFYITFDSTVNRLPEVLTVLKTELERFGQKGPTTKEIELAKQYSLGRLATGFESSLGVARYLADEEFDQEGILLPEDRMRIVEEINPDQVWEAGRKLIDWRRVQVALMNDFSAITKEKFAEIATGLA